MNRFTVILIFVFTTAFISSCEESFNSASDMFQYINNSENGLIKTKVINNIEIQVKYLPPEFLTYREVKNLEHYNKQYIDSLLNLYKSCYAFLLKIGPEDEQSGEDIMLKDVYSVTDFKVRAQRLNFEIGEYVSLDADGIVHKPVLSTMENVYGMHSHRNIYIVFSPNDNNKSLLKAEKIDVSFDDELFDTGINHFVFKKKDINNIPKVKFWKYL